MTDNTVINYIKRLNDVYSLIPSITCKHCHECDGPIYWFKIEEINIRKYLEEQKIAYITWSNEMFKQNNDSCPYLQNNKCIIYPVRPIVCRLQGLVDSLPCKCNDNCYISNDLFIKIKEEFNKILKDMNSLHEFYSTRKI